MTPRTRRARALVAPLALLALCAWAPRQPRSASADVIVPWDAWAAPTPAQAGTGLSASAWNGLFPSISTAEAFADAHAPDAHFHSTTIDYPRGNLQTLANPATHAQFLGADFASSDAPASANAHNMVYRFLGFIAIPAAGDVLFSVGSSDGLRLSIGGVDVMKYEQPNGFYYRNEVAHFSRAGLYPIALAYFSDWDGVTGVELHASLPGGTGPAPLGTTGIVSEALLYTSVPAPALSSLALALLPFAARRRR